MLKKALIAREQLEKRFSRMRPLEMFKRPPKGWIRAIRDSLGMTSGQLAERMQVSQSRIMALEKNEVSFSVTLHSLERAAQAMGCTLVYALVPHQPLDEMVKQQALRIARQTLQRTTHTMMLEAQSVELKDTQRHLQEMVQELIEKHPTKVWILHV